MKSTLLPNPAQIRYTTRRPFEPDHRKPEFPSLPQATVAHFAFAPKPLSRGITSKPLADEIRKAQQ